MAQYFPLNSFSVFTLIPSARQSAVNTGHHSMQVLGYELQWRNTHEKDRVPALTCPLASPWQGSALAEQPAACLVPSLQPSAKSQPTSTRKAKDKHQPTLSQMPAICFNCATLLLLFLARSCPPSRVAEMPGCIHCH